ncbi:PPR containing plant-like protein [Medicago truncatula]|nr:PPR containing plant-like protein [Medicago truncatula]
MMSSKKASLVTVNSLMRLCNRCCSRHVANCIKGSNTSRDISTAAERWDYQANDSSDYQQNRPRFHQQNASGYFPNNHASSERIYYGSGQTAHGGHVNNNITQNVVQNNLAEHNGSVNEDFGQRNFKMQHKVGVGVDNSRGFGMHPYGSFERHNWRLESGETMKYPNSHSLLTPIEYQGHHENLTQNRGRWQQARNSDNQNSASDTDKLKKLDEICKEGEVKKAIAVLQELEKLHTYVDLYLCLRLMQLCGKAEFLEEAKVVHRYVLQHLSPLTVRTCIRILEMYFQCGSVDDAVNVFRNMNMTERKLIEELDSSCMEGEVKEAIDVLQVLEKFHIHVDLDRCLRLMQQCGKTKSLEEAKVVHRYVLQHLSPLKVSTCNGILEMYFQCGSVDDAVNVFKNMNERDLTTIYIMIKQLAKNGFAEDSIDLFTQFKRSGLKPDGQMFIGVFGACSMLGDIVEGMLHFESMSRDYEIVPTMEHYVSIVDMIGSIGNLDEALEFIEKMPMEPSVEVWETLMNSCRVHGNTELGDRCAELVEKLDPSRLNEKSKVSLLLIETSDITKNKKQNKPPDNNPVGNMNRIHEYRAGDTSLPENNMIYALLRRLRVQMKEAGYIAETRFCLHDVDQEDKEDALLGHSERLAIAKGLLNSPARSTIRVIKNLRVCGDCHTALKIISDLVGREFIIRDAKRFHHFKNGLCSCRDYW